MPSFSSLPPEIHLEILHFLAHSNTASFLALSAASSSCSRLYRARRAYFDKVAGKRPREFVGGFVWLALGMSWLVEEKKDVVADGRMRGKWRRRAEELLGRPARVYMTKGICRDKGMKARDIPLVYLQRMAEVHRMVLEVAVFLRFVMGYRPPKDLERCRAKRVATLDERVEKVRAGSEREQDCEDSDGEWEGTQTVLVVGIYEMVIEATMKALWEHVPLADGVSRERLINRGIRDWCYRHMGIFGSDPDYGERLEQDENEFSMMRESLANYIGRLMSIDTKKEHSPDPTCTAFEYFDSIIISYRSWELDLLNEYCKCLDQARRIAILKTLPAQPKPGEPIEYPLQKVDAAFIARVNEQQRKSMLRRVFERRLKRKVPVERLDRMDGLKNLLYPYRVVNNGVYLYPLWKW